VWLPCTGESFADRLSSGDLDEARTLTDRRRRRMRVSNPYCPPPRVEARVDGSVSPLGAEVDRGVEAPTTGRPARSEADWSGYRVPRGDDGDGLSTPIVSWVDTTYPLAHRTSNTLQFQIYYYH
jgi:hypothetical protein